MSDPQLAMLLSTARINLFMSGKGSGKSYNNGIKLYEFIKKFPDAMGFIGANYYDQLNTATLLRIRQFWKMNGITEYDKVGNPGGHYVVDKKPPDHFIKKNHDFKSYNNIISFYNGHIIFTGSMENAEAHEGKEFNYAFLDETQDTDESSVKEIILARLRRKGIYLNNGILTDHGTERQQHNPLYITTSPAKTDWLNEWFCLDKYVYEISSQIYSKETFFQKLIDDKFVVISSTFHNSKNVGLNYIEDLLKNNSEEKGKSLVYGNPFSTTGGEFYSSFNRLKHVRRIKYNPRRAIHISFDQNTVPYNTALIFQVSEDKDAAGNRIYVCGCVDEICLENPRNSTEEVCEEFIRRYPRHDAGLFYYGDASGHNRSVMSKDFKHHYQIVEYKLAKYLNNSSDRTSLTNPSVPKRRDFLNAIFEDKLPIRFYIDEECRHTIADFMYVKQDLEGKKDKHIVTDPDSGEKYQKYGHCSDSADYLIVELFKKFYNG